MAKKSSSKSTTDKRKTVPVVVKRSRPGARDHTVVTHQRLTPAASAAMNLPPSKVAASTLPTGTGHSESEQNKAFRLWVESLDESSDLSAIDRGMVEIGKQIDGPEGFEARRVQRDQVRAKFRERLDELGYGDSVPVTLRVNPTPGQYFERHVHRAGFVEGQDPCVDCDNPPKTTAVHDLDVNKLTWEAQELIAYAAQHGKQGFALPFGVGYESTRTCGDEIDEGKFPDWELHRKAAGGTLEAFRAHRNTFTTRGWQVYGGSYQRSHTPEAFFNKMAQDQTKAGWQLARKDR